MKGFVFHSPTQTAPTTKGLSWDAATVGNHDPKGLTQLLLASNDLTCGSIRSDRISGGTGREMLTGGRNNDTMTSGLGADQIYGGLGADMFEWTSL